MGQGQGGVEWWRDGLGSARHLVLPLTFSLTLSFHPSSPSHSHSPSSPPSISHSLFLSLYFTSHPHFSHSFLLSFSLSLTHTTPTHLPTHPQPPEPSMSNQRAGPESQQPVRPTIDAAAKCTVDMLGQSGKEGDG